MNMLLQYQKEGADAFILGQGAINPYRKQAKEAKSKLQAQLYEIMAEHWDNGFETAGKKGLSK